MTEQGFWKCTPCKLFALLEAHNKANTVDEDNNEYKPKQKVEKLSLEEALAWAGKR